MRKIEPYLIVQLLENFAKKKKIPVAQIEHFIEKKWNFRSENVVRDLIHDGIIEKVPGNETTRPMVQLVSEADIQPFTKDWYCFECFEPGELVKCRLCTRVFHPSCFRRNPERPNYVIPATNVISEYDDEPEDETCDNETLSNSRQSSMSSGNLENINSIVHNASQSYTCTTPETIPPIRKCRVNLFRIITDSTSVKTTSNEFDQNELEKNLIHPDVLCIGEVRPPTRQRRQGDQSTLLKKEESSGEDYENCRDLCTCCRILENAKLTQPPNLLRDELCHLLNYTFKRNRSYIKGDIYKILESRKLTNPLISLAIKFLFKRRPVTTFSKIESRINENQYELIDEILMDVLELQFVIGVLLGQSAEFDGSKFLVRDITYDLVEIRRCPDCFRHSSDKISPMWFALPCVQRHELVFAKCPGYSYWPAKIVRVLRNAKKYDVRFFGGNHERYLVDISHTREIDAILPQSKSITLKRAMAELYCYQTLQTYQPELFSFYANKNEVNRIIEKVINAINENEWKPNAKRRNITIKRQHNPLIGILNGSIRGQKNLSETPISEKISFRNRSPPILRCLGVPSNSPTPPPPAPIESVNLATTTMLTIQQHIQEMNALREQHQREVARLQRELIIAKKNPYCSKCLKPAKFLCCISAWYCSYVCQREHWPDHQNSCSNL